MADDKKPMTKEEREASILTAIRNGASVHQLSAKFALSIDEARELLDNVAKETREGAVQHRIMLRSLLREQAPLAIRTLYEIATAKVLAETDEEFANLNLRFKAADKLLQYATKFMIEDIPTSAVEQGKAEEMIQTIFDFESVVTDDGATTLVAKPTLILVENE